MHDNADFSISIIQIPLFGDFFPTLGVLIAPYEASSTPYLLGDTPTAGLESES